MPEEAWSAPVLQPVTSMTSASAAGWRLVTDLDVASEDRARADLAAAVTECRALGKRWVLLDTDGVFVDVRGANVLLAAGEVARAAGCRVVIVSPPRSLRTIWEAFQLDGAVALVESQREASLLIESERHGHRP